MAAAAATTAAPAVVELVASADGHESLGAIHVWDPRTGTLVASFKGTAAAGPAATAIAPNAVTAVVAQRQRNIVHVYRWGKVRPPQIRRAGDGAGALMSLPLAFALLPLH